MVIPHPDAKLPALEHLCGNQSHDGLHLQQSSQQDSATTKASSHEEIVAGMKLCHLDLVQAATLAKQKWICYQWPARIVLCALLYGFQ